MNEHWPTINSTLLGVMTLCLLSAFQKLFLGTPQSVHGYLIPATCGGLLGAILGQWREQALSARDRLSRQVAASSRDRDEAFAKVRMLEERLEALTFLPEILPICASCKKIRDAQGQWREVTEYIEHVTSSRFSHGICPECARTLYPGLKAAKAEDTVPTASGWDISRRVHGTTSTE